MPQNARATEKIYSKRREKRAVADHLKIAIKAIEENNLQELEELIKERYYFVLDTEYRAAYNDEDGSYISGHYDESIDTRYYLVRNNSSLTLKAATELKAEFLTCLIDHNFEVTGKILNEFKMSLLKSHKFKHAVKNAASNNNFMLIDQMAAMLPKNMATAIRGNESAVFAITLLMYKGYLKFLCLNREAKHIILFFEKYTDFLKRIFTKDEIVTFKKELTYYCQSFIFNKAYYDNEQFILVLKNKLNFFDEAFSIQKSEELKLQSSVRLNNTQEKLLKRVSTFNAQSSLVQIQLYRIAITNIYLDLYKLNELTKRRAQQNIFVSANRTVITERLYLIAKDIMNNPKLTVIEQFEQLVTAIADHHNKIRAEIQSSLFKRKSTTADKLYTILEKYQHHNCRDVSKDLITTYTLFKQERGFYSCLDIPDKNALAMLTLKSKIDVDNDYSRRKLIAHENALKPYLKKQSV